MLRLRIIAISLFLFCQGIVFPHQFSEKQLSIKELVGQYIPVQITTDTSFLSSEQKELLHKLIKAASYIDDIFWQQVSYEGPSLEQELTKSDNNTDKDLLTYLKINHGPFDRINNNEPFIGKSKKNTGATFYPPGMTKKEFLDFVADNPSKKDAFESPFTVIRKEGNTLVAIPYSKEYQKQLSLISKSLLKAAAITKNPPLKNYLDLLSKSVLTDNYYQSDCSWIDLKENIVEALIGPYEVYEDDLLGLKTSYEAFIYINDFAATQKAEEYLNYFEKMQNNLPVTLKYKKQTNPDKMNIVRVANEVYNAGDALAGIQALAFTLPNDPGIKKNKGCKQIILKNVIEAKFNNITMPVARILIMDDDLDNVTSNAYFTTTLLHEISHSLGVYYVVSSDTPVYKALEELYSIIEEAKAEVLAMYNINFLIKKGLIDKNEKKQFYTTYLTDIFRVLRFGLHEAHAKSIILQYNWMAERGAFTYDPASEKFCVNMDKIEPAIKDLAKKLLELEGNGNYEEAKKFIDAYGEPSPILENAIIKLHNIPVDIIPIFTPDL